MDQVLADSEISDQPGMHERIPPALPLYIQVFNDVIYNSSIASLYLQYYHVSLTVLISSPSQCI